MARSTFELGSPFGLPKPLVGWQQLAAPGPWPLQSQPAVVRDSKGALHVFAVGSDQQVWHGLWQEEPGPKGIGTVNVFAWGATVPLPFLGDDRSKVGVQGVGHLEFGTNRLGVVANDDVHFEVFASDIPKPGFHQRVFHAGPKGPWLEVPGTPDAWAPYDIAVSGDPKGRQQVFVSDSGGDLFFSERWLSHYDWGGWNPGTTPPASDTSLAVAQNGNGDTEVVKPGLSPWNNKFVGSLLQLADFSYHSQNWWLVGALNWANSLTVDQLVLTSDRRLAAFAHAEAINDLGMKYQDLEMISQVDIGDWGQHNDAWVDLGGDASFQGNFAVGTNATGYLEAFAWGPGKQGSIVLWHRVQCGRYIPPPWLLWLQWLLKYSQQWLRPLPPYSLLPNDPDHLWSATWWIAESTVIGDLDDKLPVILAPAWPGRLDLFAVTRDGNLFYNYQLAA